MIDEALSVPVAGKIRLTCAVEDDFVRFLFTDMRREKTREELNQLFYPNLVRMTAGERESCVVRSTCYANRLFATMTNLPEEEDAALMQNLQRKGDLPYTLRCPVI